MKASRELSRLVLFGLVLLVLVSIPLSAETNTSAAANDSVNDTSYRFAGQGGMNESNHTQNETRIDNDNDGFAIPEDCDDSNSMINPSATEICNGIDDNCNMLIDEGFDNDHDGFFRQGCTGYDELDCDDSNPLANPNATEIIGNGVDDDCNASTLDKILFVVRTNQALYYLGESGTFTIEAIAGADVFVTITTPSPTHNSILSFSGPYPATQSIPYLRRAGNYSIDAVMEYHNFTNTTRVGFVVENTISGSIDCASTVQRGEPLSINAISSGGLGTLRYYWGFGDGSSASGKTLTHTYSASGSYTITLMINDSEQNQWRTSRTVSVAEKYKLTVTVKNSTTVVKNAKVEFNGLEKDTDSDGKAVFSPISQGSYTLRVSRSGYETHTETIELNSNLSKTVELDYRDNSVPSIVLTAPADGLEFDAGKLTLRFRAYDNTEMECVLYLSTDNSWWSREAVSSDVQNDVERGFEVKNLSAGPYWWKVRCEDSSSNAEFSQTRKFVIRQKEQSSGGGVQLPPAAPSPTKQEAAAEQPVQDQASQDLLKELDSIMTNYEKLGAKEQEAIRAMQLEEEMTAVKRNIQNYNRDLFNIRFRRLNDSEMARITQELQQSLEAQKNSIVKSVEVLKSSNFVKYFSKEELVKANVLLSSSNDSRYKSLDVSNEGIMKLQSLATVSTRVYVLRLDYLYAGQKTITAVEKKIEFTNLSGVTNVIEVIPKEIAAKSDELAVRGAYRVVEKDPVLEFQANESSVIYYSIDKEVEPGIIEQTMTILIPRNLEEGPAAKVTGFSVATVVGGALGNTIYLVIIVIVVAVITGLAYFWQDVKSYLPSGKEKNEVPATGADQLGSLLERIESRLKENDLDSAKASYAELREAYSQMTQESKSRFGNNLVEVYHRIQRAEVISLAGRIEQHCRERERERAHELYQRLSQLYKALPKHHKEAALKRCLQAHRRLHEA